tara:strand:- start:12891 stop:13955 length:1065 start_codon:yes stop_codon:yes gene_type:complete
MGLIKVNRGKRPIQDKDKLTKSNKKLDNALRTNARPLGLNGDEIIEPTPSFNRASCEDVMHHGNSWIVLGRDRDGSLNSGYMGATATAASSIDLVVGRGSSHKPAGNKYGTPPDKNISVNPNFFTDAARIYISQKADIDEYFGLCETKYAPPKRSTARSGIGVKADCVRIIGRNNVKIVTGKGLGEKAPPSGEPNSAGGKIDGPGTISLIAGNYVDGHTVTKFPFFKKVDKLIPDFLEERVETLQPIPKGDNLIECIREIMSQLNDLSSLVLANANGIRELAGATGTHFHDYGGGFGPTTNASILGARMIPTYIRAFSNLLDNFSSTYNQGTFQTQFLTKNSPYYINSRHVFTT